MTNQKLHGAVTAVLARYDARRQKRMQKRMQERADKRAFFVALLGAQERDQERFDAIQGADDDRPKA